MEIIQMRKENDRNEKFERIINLITRDQITKVLRYAWKQHVKWFGHVTQLPPDSVSQKTFTLETIITGHPGRI